MRKKKKSINDKLQLVEYKVIKKKKKKNGTEDLYSLITWYNSND